MRDKCGLNQLSQLFSQRVYRKRKRHARRQATADNTNLGQLWPIAPRWERGVNINTLQPRSVALLVADKKDKSYVYLFSFSIFTLVAI